jgi:peptide/nickel transport system substrate-binding protein
MDNVYQGLVFYNYTNVGQYAPILAVPNSWAVSPNYKNYNFSLRQDAYFMNGQPFNASAVWFSINRVMVMNQAGVSYYTDLLYNATTALTTGYVLPLGVDNALAANGYVLSTTNSTLRQIQAVKDLAAILSDFNPSNSTIQAIMSYPNQAVSVVNNYEVSFHLLNPYIPFFEVLSSPASMAICPSFVDANGGVQPNLPNTYINTHSCSTGPYYVKSYTQGEVLVLQANPNYWAAKLSASETNVMLTPPHVPVIILEYVVEASSMIQGIEDNKAQLLEGAPIPCLSPVYLPSVESAPGVRVVSFPSAVKFTFLMITLDTEKYPYNITNFRMALADAINYSEIFSSVSGPYGVPYVGPISPGLPYYNPGNLPPYSYNPSQAISLLAGLGFQLSLPNGTTVNPNGPIFAPTLTYANDDPAELKIAQEMQVMYLNVGLDLNLDPVTDSQMYYSISLPGTNSGYPGMLLWYWFPDWPDAVYQDLFTQVNVLFGGIAGDVSWFNNTSVNSLTANISFETNPSVINSTVAQVYQIVYKQVPDIWLYAEVPYSVQANYLNGVIYNAGIQGYYFPLMYYQTPG